MRFRRAIALRSCVLILFVGSMWIVRIADTFRPDGSSIAGSGVIPRTTGGSVAGILSAPFIHANWPHLIANTVPESSAASRRTRRANDTVQETLRSFDYVFAAQSFAQSV